MKKSLRFEKLEFWSASYTVDSAGPTLAAMLALMIAHCEPRRRARNRCTKGGYRSVIRFK